MQPRTPAIDLADSAWRNAYDSGVVSAGMILAEGETTDSLCGFLESTIEGLIDSSQPDWRELFAAAVAEATAVLR